MTLPQYLRTTLTLSASRMLLVVVTGAINSLAVVLASLAIHVAQVWPGVIVAYGMTMVGGMYYMGTGDTSSMRTKEDRS